MRDPEYRDARPEDAAELTGLALTAKQHWGYSQALMDLWRGELEITEQRIREHRIVVAEVDGVLIGVFEVRPAGEVAELEGLWVHPKHMGRGIGRSLFRMAVQEAENLGAQELVIASDPHAEGFYKAVGARLEGSVPSRPADRRLSKFVYNIAGEASA